MPVIHRFGPYGFFVHSNENQAIGERPHVHVDSAEGSASFWLEPVSLRILAGVHSRARSLRIRRIVDGSRETMLRQVE